MELDRLAVQLRLRNPWEAMDLGFAMARAWMLRVYGAWLAAALPLFALMLLVLPPQWAAIALWWLKPGLDRVVLHVVANGVFGDLPSIRATLRALPRALTPGLIASLTWLRLAPARSFNLAVWQLERQRGRAARARREQLHRRGGGNAVWLTAVCLHFEIALALSVMAMFDLLLPATDTPGVGLFQLLYGDSPLSTQWAVAVTYFAVVTILEPAYVAAGFALYLNRRTALEGWDLELGLRRMSQRWLGRRPAGPAATPPPTPALDTAGPAAGPGPVAPQAAMRLVGWLAASALVLTAAAGATPADAQTPAARPPSQHTSDPAEEVKRVYRRPELNPYAERTVLEYLGPEQRRKPRADAPLWWEVVTAAAGDILRILAWAGIGLAVAFLVYYLLRRFDPGRRSGETGRVLPATLFGLDVRPESLPDDVAATALRLLQEGRPLQALSLLYRGTLSALLHRDGVALTTGDTEADCLRKSLGHVPTTAQAYLGHLLGAWQHAAYARREVPRGEIERLCAEWPRHFAPPRTEPGGAA